jgi:CheY-like chemotaxis protein
VIAAARVASEPHAADAVRVMVCDDSAVIRGAVARMLDADLGVKVVARVSNGQLAIDELKRTPVDVLVLDIEMPVMDGMTAACRSWPQGYHGIDADHAWRRRRVARIAAGCGGLCAEAIGCDR